MFRCLLQCFRPNKKQRSAETNLNKQLQVQTPAINTGFENTGRNISVAFGDDIPDIFSLLPGLAIPRYAYEMVDREIGLNDPNLLQINGRKRRSVHTMPQRESANLRAYPTIVEEGLNALKDHLQQLKKQRLANLAGAKRMERIVIPDPVHFLANFLYENLTLAKFNDGNIPY